MAIVLSCPSCGQQSSVGEEHAGKKSVCPFCNATLIIPSASGPAYAAAPVSTLPPSSKGGLSGWIVLVIVLACMVPCSGILIGLLLPAVQAAREAGRRAKCINNERQIAVAMMNIEALKTRFPPAATIDIGNRFPVSWRVEILPYLDQVSLYKQYDHTKAWDDPANAAVLNAMPPVFGCPSDPDGVNNETSYFMITGPGTMGGAPGPLGAGPIQLRNGPNHTIMLVEVAGRHVPWTQPRDITVAELSSMARNGQISMHPRGFNVAYADGHCDFKSMDNIDIDELVKEAASVKSGQMPMAPRKNRPMAPAANKNKLAPADDDDPFGP